MKTLILYASTTGTTQKCAEMLKNLIPNSDLFNLQKEKPNPVPYDTVIIGGGVRMGSLHKLMSEYINGTREIIVKKRLGLFVCSSDISKGELYIKNNIPEDVASASVAMMSFGGEMDISRARGFDKFIMKMLLKSKNADGMKNTLDLERVKKFSEIIQNKE